MVFNNLFTPKNKKPTAELFLAVEIHESMIKSAVWQVEDETPSITALGSYELWDSEDSLVNGVDASLSEAIRGLASEPDRVIFGLPDSWLADNRIHPTKQKIIKRLINDLGLKAIGMVTITEAIVSHLKTQEGVPPTAILLEIYPSKVIVSLVNLGEIQAQEEVGRSDDLARDVEEGLARFDAEKLPARFILTNGSDLENEEQQIIGYPWTEKLPFIHIPKVQVLPIDFSIRAIALSGGTEAAKSIGVDVAPTETSEAVEATKSQTVIESVTTDLSSLGFSIEGGVEELFEIKQTETVVGSEEPDNFEEESAQPKQNLISKLPKPSFPKIKLPQFKLPTFNLGKLSFIIPLIILFIALAGVTAYYLFFGKVTVQLSLAPVRVSQVLDIAIGTTSKDNVLSLIATKKTVSAKATDSLSTTGEAVVGEKATGKVVIYNLSNQQFSLKVGTKLSSGNLIFTLDSPVSISSTSGQISDTGTITLSNAAANVTASKIGAESNLEKGIPLTVDNYPKSIIQAKVDSALSGGTSRTVKAVSKSDQDKLLAQVEEKIKTSIDDQQKKDDPDTRFVQVGTIRYISKTFDKTVGQEATNLSLDLAGDMDVLVYSHSQLMKLIENKILSSSQPNLVIDSNQTQVSLTEPVAIDANTFGTKANVQAVLFPKVDENGITNVVKGKSVAGLKSILQTIPGYQSATVYINPNIPLLTQLLPLTTSLYTYRISK